MPLPAGFVKLDDVRNSPNGKKEHRKYRGVYYLDEGETNEYAFNVRLHGVDGTRVPKAGEQGGVEGTKNAYGTVVLGKVIGRDDMPVGDVPPPEFAQKKETKTGEETAKTEFASPEMEEEIEALLRGQRQVYAPPPVVEKKLPEIAVSISSPTFGSYKGKYREVQLTDECVVLGFDPEASSFTPPVRPEPEELTLKIGGKSYAVYYTGIEFTLDRYGVTLQVYARKQE